MWLGRYYVLAVKATGGCETTRTRFQMRSIRRAPVTHEGTSFNGLYTRFVLVF